MIYEYEFLDTGERVERDAFGLREIDGRRVKRIYSTGVHFKGVWNDNAKEYSRISLTDPKGPKDLGDPT